MWTDTMTHLYRVDTKLAAALGSLFAGRSLVEFGAGSGCYAEALRRHGVDVQAFDGMPGLEQQTDGLVKTADLTQTQELGAADWVMCLEVGEHVPQRYEATLLDNLHRHNRRGIVLSWAKPDQPGQGHVTMRTHEQVAQNLSARYPGVYREDFKEQKRLADATTLHWLKGNVRVFRRRLHSQ